MASGGSLLVQWEADGFVAAALAGALLAALTGLRAAASHRLVPEPSLRRFYLGFYLLAASQVAAAGQAMLLRLAGETIPRETFDAYDALFWFHYATILAGLVLVFASFGRHPFRWSPAVAPVLLIWGPILELLTIVVLFFLVLHAGLNHIARKGRGSRLVAIGFFFLFTAHTLNLVGYSPLEPRWWAAECVNLLGFVILYASVMRRR